MTVGMSNPCLSSQESTDTIAWEHGDDVVIVGEEETLLGLEEELQKHMILKRRALLGPDPGDDKHVTILNRHITWEGDGPDSKILYESDPRHVDIALHQLGLDDPKSKGVVTPVTRSQGNYDDIILDGAKAKLFRSVCMRIGFVAQDRTEIQYAWKETTRHMSQPTAGAMNRLKRLGRFLKYRPRCVQVFRTQESPKYLTTRGDSDFAGCLATRKSTSSTQLIHGKHLLRSSATTQSAVSYTHLRAHET